MKITIKLMSGFLFLFAIINGFYFSGDINPSKIQIYCFIINVLLLVTSIKYTNENNNILISFSKRNFLILYFSLAIQIVLVINSCFIPNNIVDGISIVLSFGSILCLYIL